MLDDVKSEEQCFTERRCNTIIRRRLEGEEVNFWGWLGTYYSTFGFDLDREQGWYGRHCLYAG